MYAKDMLARQIVTEMPMKMYSEPQSSNNPTAVPVRSFNDGSTPLFEMDGRGRSMNLGQSVL